MKVPVKDKELIPVNDTLYVGNEEEISVSQSTRQRLYGPSCEGRN